jgi:hypothetical protein
MLQALTRKYGPLPGWAWGLIVIALAYFYMQYSSKKKAAAAAQQAAQNQGVSSNLGTVPVSNMTTTAQPMPIQLGDTFVNTGGGGGVSTNGGAPVTTVIGGPGEADQLTAAQPPQVSPAVNV